MQVFHLVELQDRPQDVAVIGPFLGEKAIQERAVEHLFPLESVNRRDALVAVDDFQGLMVQHEHRVGNVVEDLMVLAFGLGQLLLQLLACGDVEAHLQRGNDLALSVADRRGAEDPVGGRTVFVQAGLLALMREAVFEGQRHWAIGAFLISSFVRPKAVGMGLRGEPFGELPVEAQQSEIAVLQRDQAGHVFEKGLVLVALGIQLPLFLSDFQAHGVDGRGQLPHLVLTVERDQSRVYAPGDLPGALDQFLHGSVDEHQQLQAEDGGGQHEEDSGQPDHPLLGQAQLPVGVRQRHDHVQRPQDLLVLRVNVAGVSGASRLVVDGTDDAEHPVALGRLQQPGPGGQVQFDQRRVGPMADVAGFRLDVGAGVDLGRPVRKFDLALLVV